ncbi:MAG TPA: A24 family peptidase [Streptosporangiaceae bacterium]
MNVADSAAAVGMAAAGFAIGGGAMLLASRAVRDHRDLGSAPSTWPAAAMSAALFAALWLRFGPSSVLPALCYLAAIGPALAVIDARYKRLPDVLTLPSYPAALLLLGVAALAGGWGGNSGGARLADAAIGLAAALLFFLLQAFIYPAGVGWGDVKLSGVIGLYLGWFGLTAFLAGVLGGYLLAAVTGIGLIAARRASRKTQLPFGPFLLAGTLAAILVH